nr:MAG TPA: hypothetical protein [Inoviridae sp.]
MDGSQPVKRRGKVIMFKRLLSVHWKPSLYKLGRNTALPG